MKLRTSILIAIVYTAVQWGLFGLGFWASDHSYGIWAGAGIAFTFMTILGAAAGLCALAAAVLKRCTNIAIPGAILLIGCALPLALLMGFGLLLGL